MGMFDAPKYLTGKDDKGYVEAGDLFWLHNAKIDGNVTIAGQTRPQAKLKVSRTRDGEQEIVFTSGAGITGMIGRMDDDDRRKMPMELRLDTIAPKTAGNNPTFVLTPADQDEPVSVNADDEIPF